MEFQPQWCRVSVCRTNLPGEDERCNITPKLDGGETPAVGVACLGRDSVDELCAVANDMAVVETLQKSHRKA